LLSEACVFGIELRGDGLFVRTSDYGTFTRRLPAVAHAAAVRLIELRPTDDSLESVFAYLVGR
jgi:ABC-2 type transport system ATP-binding protein